MKRFLTILMLILAPLAASAQSRAQLEKEIAILDKQLKATSAKTTNALTELDLTRSRLEASRKLVQESNRELTAINAKISQKEKEIKTAQSNLDTMEVYYEKLVRNAYKNRDTRVWYMYLLSGKNMAQNIRRFSYLKDMSGKLRSQAEKITEEKMTLEAEKAELLKTKEEARQILAQRTSEMNALKRTEDKEKNVIAKLNKEKAKYQKELESKRRQAEDLQRKATQMVNDNTPAKVTVSKNSPEYKISKGFAESKGKMTWPVDGAVVEHFGQRYHPVYKKVKLPFNNGVDIATSPDAQVRCVYEGVVKQVIVMPGYHNCVLVQHGEFFTFYCKLESVKVKAGSNVKAGDLIGTVDTMNGTTQLHFQLWQGKKPQNPENWLVRKK